MSQYRIKYKKKCGYFVQYRDRTSYWTWQDVGNGHDDNFRTKYYITLEEAQKKVEQLCREKMQEKTVYLYRS